MAEIKAFNGILYNTEKVNIENVVAPPYDVISEEMQEDFYRADRCNVIRLILGREEKSDTPRNNRYTRASNFLGSWLKNKVLIRDKKPSIYVYVQEYLYRSERKSRMGFIALMKIEDPRESGILPHEYTLAKPKEDRLKLITETRVNLCPIFSLFQDRKNEINTILKRYVKSRNPIFSVETEGVLHRLWRMEDKHPIERIKASMRKRKVFIADGHHRYEVALAYRNMMRKKRADFRKSMDYVMMYFSDMNKKSNLTILSTHRVLRDIAGFNRTKIMKDLRGYFSAEKFNNPESLINRLEATPKGKHSFGIYLGRGTLYLLTLTGPKRKTHALKKLDVTILHDLIINKILGVKIREDDIKYTRNEKDAITLVDKGGYRLAFFLKPTDVMEMKAIAEKGEMMPQKSTYFYPKLLTGLVINKF